MRIIVLIWIFNAWLFANEFPKVFDSVGDEIYLRMQQYQAIKDMEIFADRPEIIEAFCQDANRSLVKGYRLDQMHADPEASVDKDQIKAYAKELRRLSNQNDSILYQLRKDIKLLMDKKDFKSLTRLKEAGVDLDQTIILAIEENMRQDKTKKMIEKLNKQAKQVKKIAESKPVPVHTTIDEASVVDVNPEPVKKLSELDYYKESLKHLKDELYSLRESTEHEKMQCLNDITAMNYWMIELLKNKDDSCQFSDAIKQMKSYDKSAASSCGQDSMRFMEWHGRLRPYVGSSLFKAEADCRR